MYHLTQHFLPIGLGFGDDMKSYWNSQKRNNENRNRLKIFCLSDIVYEFVMNNNKIGRITY